MFHKKDARRIWVKQVLIRTVKTQMKGIIMLHFIRVYTVWNDKQILRQKYNILENNNLTPLDMYNGPFQVILSNHKEDSINKRRVKVYAIFNPSTIFPLITTYLLCYSLFDLILFVPSTFFQLNRDGSPWVEPVLS